MKNGYILAVQILFIAGIAVGSQNLDLQDKRQLLNIARYAIYILTIVGIPGVCQFALQLQSRQPLGPLLQKAAEKTSNSVLVYLSSGALLLYFEQSLFERDFLYLYLASLLVKYFEMATKPSINYGVGMACSYFEGYLMHVIPSDGAKFVGFEENMRMLEDQEGVLFPVKKMFIIITKDLYSPPDLKEFNRGTDVPYLEAFNVLNDVKKSVAGVRDRTYHNTAYKIYRPAGAPPVCLAAECASPLHTLHKVLNNRALYSELADIDVPSVVAEFCATLRAVLDKSAPCRGKCEFIYYDHEDPKQNLAEILLERIRELEPDYEQKIAARRNENELRD